MIHVSAEMTFYLSTRQGKLLITKVCFPCSDLLKPQVAYLTLSLECPPVPTPPSPARGAPRQVHVIKLGYFLLLICLKSV